MYVREQKAKDSLVRKLVCNKPRTTVFWGSGTTFFASPKATENLRGSPAPAKKFLRAVTKHPFVRKVVIVDEYRSSTIDPYTMTRVEHVPGERKVDGTPGKSLYSVLRSPNGGTVWNRDVMGAINISIIAKMMACGYEHPYRGPDFQ